MDIKIYLRPIETMKNMNLIEPSKIINKNSNPRRISINKQHTKLKKIRVELISKKKRKDVLSILFMVVLCLVVLRS